MNKEEYEKDLKERQEAHLKELDEYVNWQPCLHDNCQNCLGTGISRTGACVHAISCPCPKCSQRINRTITL